MKILADPDSGLLLGAHVIGPDASILNEPRCSGSEDGFRSSRGDQAQSAAASGTLCEMTSCAGKVMVLEVLWWPSTAFMVSGNRCRLQPGAHK